MSAPPAGAPLAVREVQKRFGTTRALRRGDLCLRAGEVHALLGENGAGKSTLIKILAGGIQPDAGEVLVGGRPARLGGVSHAIGLGIMPIYQQLSLLPHLSVLENLFAFELARGTALRPTQRRQYRAGARRALEAVGLDIDPAAPVGELSLAERQLVEIARSVTRECSVLLLDEPTASLGGDDVDRLFRVVRQMRDQGRAVLLISHRLDEIERVCDRVSVLRDGETVMDGAPLPEVSRRAVVEAMVGREVAETSAAPPAEGEDVLRVDGLSAPGAFRDVDLTVRQGEIVGMVGLIGSGATELGEALAGNRRIAAGALRVGGRDVKPGDRGAALRAGVGFIPADRDRDGLFPGQAVLHNASASSLWRLARGGWLRIRQERREFGTLLNRLQIKPADPSADIGALSGGNRQKAIVARSLAGPSRVLVALEPTRGVDVAARRQIHEAILEAAAGGLAVVIASTDLDEVMALSHRIVVMRSGRVVAALDPAGGSGEVVHHLTGARA